MRTASPPARPNHDTAYRGRAAAVLTKACLAVVAGCGALTTFAQGGVPCTAIVDDAERLACYDRALRPAAPAPSAAPVPAARVPEARAVAPADDRSQERRVRESAAPAPPAPAPAAPRAGDEEPASVAIVVVGMRALPGRETTFTADDGTAWVQTDSQRLLGLPDTPFTAEIRPGAMGSYFLVPAGRVRAVRVRPVR